MKLISIIIATLSTCLTVPSYAMDAGSHPVVIELFTSQGCSSCPPADRLIEKYADMPGVLPLSYHVDYWDRLGWKDPFSLPESTGRQHLYSRFLGSGLYTPQAVIQGTQDVVGSNAIALRLAVKKAGEQQNWIPVTLQLSDNELHITLPETQGIHANLYLIGYQKHATTSVPRGENAGRTLSHRNSVTSISRIRAWQGNEQNLVQAIPPGDGVAVLVQSSDTGEVIGAGWL